MSEKLPAIYVGADRTSVRTKVHDHSRDAYGGYGVVKCDDPNCRAELILQGGVEMVSRTWFCALGEDISFTIPQAGIKNRDGSQFSHMHEPHGKDWAIECDSPDCNAFFQGEWNRFDVNKRAGNPGRSAVSPSERDRPKSIAQMDEEAAVFAENTKRAAAIEQEVKRQTIAQLWPLPR